MERSELTAWERSVTTFHMPRWEELPNIDLYMDQVVILIEKYLSIYRRDSQERFLTPAMINNYVKSKVIPPPVKKRYNRTHLAYLIFVCILKQVLTIAEIRTLLARQLEQGQLDQVYDAFCGAQESAVQAMLQRAKQAALADGQAGGLPPALALNMALLANAGKTLAEKILDLTPH